MSAVNASPADAAFSAPLGLLTLGGLFATIAVSLDGPLVAIADIADHFAVTRGEAQMTTVLFMLGYALAHVPTGLLGDRYGRRPIILAGLALSWVMSLLAAFAPSFDVLLGARFLQGAFTCAGAMLARAVVRDVASGARAAQITSHALACLAFLIIVAPLLSGLWLNLGGWRWVLAQVSVYLLVVMVLTLLVIPETLPERSAVLRPGEQLMLSLRAFLASSQSILAALLGGIVFATYYVFANIGASVFRDAYGLSGSVFAGIFAGLAVAQLIMAQFNARAVRRLGSHTMLRCALLTCVLGTGLSLYGLTLESAPVALVTAAALCFAMTHGLVLPNSIALTMDPLPRSAGFAAAIHGMLQSGTAALTGFVVSYAYNGSAGRVMLLNVLIGLATVAVFTLARRMLLADQLSR